MSENDSAVMTDTTGQINDEPMNDGENQSFNRFGGDRRFPRPGNRSCYSCGQMGHMSYDCHRPSGGFMSFRGNRNNQRCFNCQREGHISRDCSFPTSPKSCYNCGNEGHLSRDCAEPRKDRPKNCFSCNQIGHIAAQCPNRA